MTIPIRNVFYLLLYAWDRLEQAELIKIAAIPETQYVDFFARVLADGIAVTLRRGLDRGFLQREEAVAGVRGRLDLGTTIKRLLPLRAQAWCRFDELEHDTLPNRILRSTLRKLLAVPDLAADGRERLRASDAILGDVHVIRLRKDTFRRVQLHSNIAHYGFLIDVCQLINENLMADDQPGSVRFRDFRRDDRQMAALFERFVFNFYRREQSTYSVGREQIRWRDVSGSTADLQYLPVMNTDVVLSKPGRKVIVETKYYGEALVRRHKTTVRPAHLYQLFAYMQNSRTPGDRTTIDGMLLYPAAEYHFDLRYRLGVHAIRVCTIDLAQDWRTIHENLLQLAQ